MKDRNNTFYATLKCVSKRLFVGDPCYALADRIYHGIWGKGGYEDGVITDENGVNYGAVVGTAFGDGYYPSTPTPNAINIDAPTKYYGVDSGTLGVVSLDEVRDDPAYWLGKIVEVETKDVRVVVDYDDGNITIGIEEGFDDGSFRAVFLETIFTNEIPTKTKQRTIALKKKHDMGL